MAAGDILTDWRYARASGARCVGYWLANNHDMLISKPSNGGEFLLSITGPVNVNLIFFPSKAFPSERRLFQWFSTGVSKIGAGLRWHHACDDVPECETSFVRAFLYVLCEASMVTDVGWRCVRATLRPMDTSHAHMLGCRHCVLRAWEPSYTNSLASQLVLLGSSVGNKQPCSVANFQQSKSVRTFRQT